MSFYKHFFFFWFNAVINKNILYNINIYINDIYLKKSLKRWTEQKSIGGVQRMYFIETIGN